MIICIKSCITITCYYVISFHNLIKNRTENDDDPFPGFYIASKRSIIKENSLKALQSNVHNRFTMKKGMLIYLMQVTGELNDDLTCWDALRAALPVACWNR